MLDSKHSEDRSRRIAKNLSQSRTDYIVRLYLKKNQHPCPLCLMKVLAGTGTEREIHRTHHSWINVPGTSPGCMKCSVTKNRFQFPQGSGDRIGNNWSMNFITPKKNQLDQFPSHQASQTEPPFHKYVLLYIQRLPWMIGTSLSQEKQKNEAFLKNLPENCALVR